MTSIRKKYRNRTLLKRLRYYNDSLIKLLEAFEMGMDKNSYKDRLLDHCLQGELVRSTMQLYELELKIKNGQSSFYYDISTDMKKFYGICN